MEGQYKQIDGQTDRGRGRQKYKQTEEGTDRKTHQDAAFIAVLLHDTQIGYKQAYRRKGNANRAMDKQTKEQTERHTWMLPLSQYSHKTHRLSTLYRPTDGRAMQTERWANRQRNRQKDTPECCLYRSTTTRHTDWVQTGLQTEGQCKQSDGQTDKGTDRKTHLDATFIAVLPQDTHIGYTIQAYRRKGNANRAMGKQTKEQTERQPGCCLYRSTTTRHTDWVQTGLQTEGQCKQSDGQTRQRNRQKHTPGCYLYRNTQIGYVQTYRWKDNANRAMDKQTDRGRNRQKDIPGCCLFRSTPTGHTGWVVPCTPRKISSGCSVSASSAGTRTNNEYFTPCSRRTVSIVTLPLSQPCRLGQSETQLVIVSSWILT